MLINLLSQVVEKANFQVVTALSGRSLKRSGTFNSLGNDHTANYSGYCLRNPIKLNAIPKHVPNLTTIIPLNQIRQT